MQRPSRDTLIALAFVMSLVLALWLLFGPSASAGGRTVESTAYAPTCGAGPRTANGNPPKVGIVAMNGVAFGTRIRVTGKQPGPYGRRDFIVDDRIGGGSVLDFYVRDCHYATHRWGRKTVTYRFLRPARARR